MRVLTLLLLATAVRPALADDPGASRGFTVGARAGALVPTSSDVKDFGTGFGIEGAAGWRFHPNLAAELSVGYQAISGKGTVEDPVYGTLTVDSKISSVPVFVTVKGIAPLGPVDLYGLAGFGIHFVTLKISVTGNGVSGDSSSSGSSFGYQVGGGATYALTPSLSLGAEVRYASSKISYTDSSGASGSIQDGGVQILGGAQLRL
jgi:opacity protein-like surface antigen